MSRGLGRTQRFILDHLDGARSTRGVPRYESAYVIAAAMTGVARPSPSAVQSVRQAIRRLEDWGLVEAKTFHSDRNGLPLRWDGGTKRQKQERWEYIMGLSWEERGRYYSGPRSPRVYVRQPDRRMLHVRLTVSDEEAAAEARFSEYLDSLGRPPTLADLADAVAKRAG